LILHKWGTVEYERAMKMMREIHSLAKREGKNHLIVCSHPKVFTVGAEGRKKEWKIRVVHTDRGGSVTCHSEGQSVFYFCFSIGTPSLFYAKVKRVFSEVFEKLDERIFFDKKRPGFYIENRKLSSLGFRYEDGVSLHGVSVNIDVDLKFHSLVNPCDLKGVLATSLRKEGIFIEKEEFEEMVVEKVCEIFDESV